MIGYISKIETLGLLDGPGVRVVVFLSGCKLRCLYCHNPEMFNMESGKKYTPKELVDFILKYKNYIIAGGVTFSGGEPLLQSKFLIEVCKKLKKHNIQIAIDTAGVGVTHEELLSLIDLIIFDVKHTDKDKYKEITGLNIDSSLKFLEKATSLNKTFWIRSVIVPDINDNEAYIESLASFVKRIPKVERIELLPYSKLGVSKYNDLNMNYKLKSKPAMDIDKCKKLEKLLKKSLNNL